MCLNIKEYILLYQIYKNTVSQYDMYPDRSMNFCKSSDKQQNNNYIYKQIWLECHDIYLKSSCVIHFYCYLQSAFIWMFNHMQNDSGWWGNILKAFIIILHWWSIYMYDLYCGNWKWNVEIFLCYHIVTPLACTAIE